jgi:hypothetical protein
VKNLIISPFHLRIRQQGTILLLDGENSENIRTGEKWKKPNLQQGLEVKVMLVGHFFPAIFGLMSEIFALKCMFCYDFDGENSKNFTLTGENFKKFHI